MKLKYSQQNIEKGQTKVRVHLVGRMEKWEDRKDFIFPHLCLIGRVEKQTDGKLFLYG